MEEWRAIKGYEGKYEVSDQGRVRSMQRNVCKIMQLEIHVKGYLRIMLSKQMKTERFFVHRLVAQAYIPNPDELPVVNHKDRNRTNNTVLNLEWATFSENTRHWQEDNRSKIVVETPILASDLPW